ncbi:hypothetical protein ACQ4LH_22225, partial [Pseudomonas peli]
SFNLRPKQAKGATGVRPKAVSYTQLPPPTPLPQFLFSTSDSAYQHKNRYDVSWAGDVYKRQSFNLCPKQAKGVTGVRTKVS